MIPRYMMSGHGKTHHYRLACTNILSDTPQALVVCMTPYHKAGRKDSSLNLCEYCLKSHYAKERHNK